MKSHTVGFKNSIIQLGRELRGTITYGNTVLEEEIISISPHFEGNLLKSVMKQLDLECSVDIPKETILNCQIGIKVSNSFEMLNFGNYVVYSSEKQEDTNKYKIICYDKMLYAMKQNEDLEITYPISIKNYLIALANKIGLTVANETFYNENLTIPSELYLGLNYTYRDILDEIAQATGSMICINDDDEIEIRYPTTTNDTINGDFLKDTNITLKEKYGPINSIVLSRSNETDNIYLQDPESVQQNGLCEVKIIDNQILNFNNRGDFLQGILDALNGIYYYKNNFLSFGVLYYEIGDFYNVQIGEDSYQCLMLNDEINITTGIEEIIHTDLPEQSESDYSKADKTDRRIRQTNLIVDKQNQTIESFISTAATIYDEKKGKGLLITDEAKKLPAWKVMLTGQKEYDSGAVVVPKTYTIVVMPEMFPYIATESKETLLTENNEEIIYSIHEYAIQCNELLKKEETCDTIEIDSNRNIVLTKRIGIENGQTYILDEEIVTTIGTLTIDLYEGKNYIYLKNDNETIMYVKYILKNDFTEAYVTDIEVNTKIEQTVTDITSIVSKKVGEDEIISKINQSAEQISINADKINLNGKILDLTGDSIVITSDNFSVDENGSMKCSDAKINGTIESSEGSIGGWTINNDGLTNGDVKLNNDGSSTIYTVADLIILRGYISGYTGFNLSGTLLEHYDLNHDGVVNSQDYMLLKILIGLQEE